MKKLYKKLIEDIKLTIQNIDGIDVVVVELEPFASMLSSYLKDNHCEKTSEEILKDLRGE